MGDYSHVEILLAESDFDPEEREFMTRLWQCYFGPTGDIDLRTPKAYEKREALRRHAHAELHLPGAALDWEFILPRLIDGQRYYLPLRPLSPVMIPPFPRQFADVYRLHRKYGIHATWYAMFSAPDREGGRYSFLTSIGAARRQFAGNFRGLWRLLFCGTDGPAVDALVRAAPPHSAGWESLRTVFDRFPFDHYLATVELLANDWGRDALVELDFCSILYNYDKDDQKAATMVRVERDSVSRVFEALDRLEVGALRGETILASSLHGYSSGGSSPWLDAPARSGDTEKLEKYLNGEFDDTGTGWPW